MKKKILCIFCALLLVLVITNPGNSSFMGFLGERELNNDATRTNYFVFSVYKVDFITADNSDLKEEYFAILGQFYKVKVSEELR